MQLRSGFPQRSAAGSLVQKVNEQLRENPVMRTERLTVLGQPQHTHRNRRAKLRDGSSAFFGEPNRSYRRQRHRTSKFMQKNWHQHECELQEITEKLSKESGKCAVVRNARGELAEEFSFVLAPRDAPYWVVSLVRPGEKVAVSVIREFEQDGSNPPVLYLSPPAGTYHKQ